MGVKAPTCKTSSRPRAPEAREKALQPMIPTLARSIQLITVSHPDPWLEPTTMRRTVRNGLPLLLG
jgi:hypothetical protein